MQVIKKICATNRLSNFLTEEPSSLHITDWHRKIPRRRPWVVSLRARFRARWSYCAICFLLFIGQKLIFRLIHGLVSLPFRQCENINMGKECKGWVDLQYVQVIFSQEILLHQDPCQRANVISIFLPFNLPQVIGSFYFFKRVPLVLCSQLFCFLGLVHLGALLQAEFLCFSRL